MTKYIKLLTDKAVKTANDSCNKNDEEEYFEYYKLNDSISEEWDSIAFQAISSLEEGVDIFCQDVDVVYGA